MGSKPRSAKRHLRQTLKQRLASIGQAAAATAAAAVADRVLSLEETRQARGILACLSFGTEIDTWRLVDRLVEDGREVWIPRAVPAGHRLTLHRFPCPLETLPFGLRQPTGESPELAPEAVDSTIGLALILGLGFDRRGHRLGYGGGYFDRFLADRPFPSFGLAYEAQIVDELPVENHDIAMDAVLTEERRIPPLPAE